MPSADVQRGSAVRRPYDEAADQTISDKKVRADGDWALRKIWYCDGYSEARFWNRELNPAFVDVEGDMSRQVVTSLDEPNLPLHTNGDVKARFFVKIWRDWPIEYSPDSSPLRPGQYQASVLAMLRCCPSISRETRKGPK